MTTLPDPDEILVQKHVNALGEHFDTVQIFCTRHEPNKLDGTTSIRLGVGDTYARYGVIRLWLLQEESQVKQETTLE